MNTKLDARHTLYMYTVLYNNTFVLVVTRNTSSVLVFATGYVFVIEGTLHEKNIAGSIE